LFGYITVQLLGETVGTQEGGNDDKSKKNYEDLKIKAAFDFQKHSPIVFTTATLVTIGETQEMDPCYSLYEDRVSAGLRNACK